MKCATVEALDRINREFYAARAAEFAATREAPWPGWERLLPHLRAAGASTQRVRGGDDALRILDLGCGTGRLARWLDGRLERPHRTLGLDRSLPILLHARGAPAASFMVADLVASSGRLPVHDASFDVAVAIGLFHHLPSFALRRALAADIARVVAPGGIAAATFWQFGAEPRFTRRAVTWEDALAIDPGEVEPGDRLLRWGASDGGPDGRAAMRYCHYTDPAEAGRLLEDLDGQVIDSFHADGRSGALNLYRVWRRN